MKKGHKKIKFEGIYFNGIAVMRGADYTRRGKVIRPAKGWLKNLKIVYTFPLK